MSTVDTLLDTAANDGKIVITVDEPSRTLKYDGEILLGVEDDHKAERIYFQAPRYITMDDTVDLLSEDIEIYVKYINAEKNTYFVQCTDVAAGEEPDTIMFSWLISETVTKSKGNIQFSVWFRKIQRFNEVGEITSLAYTEWDIYDNPSDNSQRLNYPNTFSCSVDFTVQNLNEQFIGIGYTYGGYASSGTILRFIKADGNYYQVYSGDNGWINKDFQTIKFTGGADILNPTLLEFLQYQGKILSWPDYMTKPAIIFNEWNTTPLTGAILSGIDVSNVTQEVITDDTATTYLLIQKIDSFDAYLNGYRGAYTVDQIDEMFEDCSSNATAYTNTKVKELEINVNNKLSNKVEIDELFPGSGEIVVTSKQNSVKNSGITLDDVIKSPRYTLLDTQTLYFGSNDNITHDFYDVSRKYNDVMVILSVENGTSSDVSISMKLSSQATGAPITSEDILNVVVPQRSNSEGAAQIRYHILKTDDGINAEYNLPIDGYSITLTSSMGDTGLKWITMLSVDSNIITIGKASVIDGSNKVTLKIYGR